MNSEERESLRLSLLRYLDATPADCTALGLLTQYCRNEGRSGLAREAVRSELIYLADKGLVIAAEKIISPENPQFRITSAGRDEYAKLST